MTEIFYLTIGLIGGLLAIIAYFLKRRDLQIDDIQRRQDERYDRMFEKVLSIEKEVGAIPHLYKELHRLEGIVEIHHEIIQELKK